MKPRDIEALLDAERRAPHPPVETQARVLRRVETTLGLAAGVAATATAAKASAATGAHTAAAVGAKAVIVKVVLGAVGAAMLGGGAYVALQHKSTPRPAALAPAPETSEPVTPRPPPQALVVPRQAPPPPPRAKPLQKGLADEQAFLEEARAALRNGSPERALNLLQQHERTFPAGQLGEARDVLAIQALIAEGKPDAARARAAEFRRRHPRSLFQPAVDASLPR